jgi:hypothetical protein
VDPWRRPSPNMSGKKNQKMSLKNISKNENMNNNDHKSHYISFNEWSNTLQIPSFKASDGFDDIFILSSWLLMKNISDDSNEYLIKKLQSARYTNTEKYSSLRLNAILCWFEQWFETIFSSWDINIIRFFETPRFFSNGRIRSKEARDHLKNLLNKR